VLWALLIVDKKILIAAIKEQDDKQRNKKKKVDASFKEKKKKTPSQPSLELSLEFHRDNHTIDVTSLQKIMKNHPYISSSKFRHWNFHLSNSSIFKPFSRI
jgi:hypothetical protein